jgi:PAS domain-containing protein
MGCLVLSDITKTRHLEESSLLKGRAFDASLTAHSITGPNGFITEANEMFLRIWGYPCLEEVFDNSPRAIFPESGQRRCHRRDGRRRGKDRTNHPPTMTMKPWPCGGEEKSGF